MKKISLVIPCYNERENISELFKQLYASLSTTVLWEIIFIDDGSLDFTYESIEENAKTYQKERPDISIHALRFSRNYGKEIAVFAGLDAVKGDAAIIMDADLQHPLSAISEMIDQWKKGYKMVVAIRSDRRNDPPIMRVFKRLFYKIFSWLSGRNLTDGAGDFRLMDKDVIESFKRYRERIRFNKGIFDDLGYKQTQITYKVQERYAGSTKWSPFKLFAYALEGMISFSTRPLDLIFTIGLLFSLVSFIILIYTLITYFFIGVDIAGYTTLATLIALFSGMQMIMIGIIGKYLGVLFKESKTRPEYIIENKFHT